MIPGLDGLRAIAFLFVLLVHTDYFLFGWTGVLLFFVLSGFLITTVLLRMKETLAPQAFFYKFYGRRFLRIFPLYYFYLFLMLGVTAILIALEYRQNYMLLYQQQLPYGLLYIYNFFHASAGYVESRFLTHFWSLSVEEQFYIFWPLVIFLTPREKLKTVFLAAIFAGPLLRTLTGLIYNSGSFGFLYPNTAVGVYVLPFSHIDAFAMGAYISRFEISKPRLQLIVMAVLLPAAGLGMEYFLRGQIEFVSSLGYQYPLGNGLRHIWGYTLIDYTFLLLIYCVVREKLWVKWLEWPPLRYLGKISYGMYIYHFAFTWFASRIVYDAWGVAFDAGKPLVLLVTFTLTLLTAALSYRWLEMPLLGLKDRYFGLKQTSPR
ncbi:MAG: acyltransferase [Anaerolineales bacterium]|nr:acyltransferase [Anaerolineales bacterium]